MLDRAVTSIGDSTHQKSGAIRNAAVVAEAQERTTGAVSGGKIRRGVDAPHLRYRSIGGGQHRLTCSPVLSQLRAGHQIECPSVRNTPSERNLNDISVHRLVNVTETKSGESVEQTDRIISRQLLIESCLTNRVVQIQRSE